MRPVISQPAHPVPQYPLAATILFTMPRESKLGRLLMTSHANRISKEDLHHMALWLDTNSMELGAFHDDAEQRAGRVVWPVVGIDPKNPTGTEYSLPLP